ncbi:MAG: hypothetical protein ACLRPW_11505 [Intestinibacter sp.]
MRIECRYFERARNKFIYSQNLYEKYTAIEYEKRKKVGKPRGNIIKKDDR